MTGKRGGAGRNKKSELEAKFVLLCRVYGITGYVREHKFALPERKWRMDFAWLESHLAVEIDGGTHLPNGGRHNTDEDRWKCNDAAARGWKMLHFSGAMLDEPDRCASLIERALGRGSDD